jgi:hypothetical protein
MSPQNKQTVYVETTVLTDLLLKTGALKEQASSALGFFEEKLLPVYAIKEFKAGPLRRFVWLHNKLVVLNSFSATLDILQRVSRTPQRYLTSTAIEALKTTAYSIGNIKARELVKKYGPNATLDAMQRDEYRLALRMAVEKAWKNRKRGFRIVQPVSCYIEVAPQEKRGQLSLEPTSCGEMSCRLWPKIAEQPQVLATLRAVTDTVSNAEHKRRSQALHDIERKPNVPVSRNQCVNLGDAVFAIFAPKDSTILSTNLRDLRPLAESLGKTCKSPSEVLATNAGT